MSTSALPRSPYPVLTENPRVDVRGDKEKNLVSATFELPGVNKENVSVDVHDSLLTVSGDSISEPGSNSLWYLLRQGQFGGFLRSFRVPDGVKVRGF